MEEYRDSEITPIPEDIAKISAGIKMFDIDWESEEIVMSSSGIYTGRVDRGFLEPYTIPTRKIYKWRKYEKN